MTDSAQNSKQILAQKGTAGTPSHSFLGGNTTGMYLAGTNQLGFSTAGAFAAVIDATGNVGIGTASPTGKMTVNGILNFGNSSGVAMSISNDFGGNTLLTLAEGSSGLRVVNSTNSAEHMRIDASGNVGIGTGSGETIGATLEVRGAVGTALRIRSTLNSLEPTGYYSIGRDTDGLLKFNGAQTTFVGYKFFNTGSEVMRIDSSGNVGIGTSSPSTLFEVANTSTTATITSTATSGYSVLSLRNTGTSGRAWQVSVGGSATGVAGSYYVYDATAAAVRMLIDSSGNVGIGTTSPAAKLQVSGNSISNNYYFGTTTAAAGTIASDTGAAGARIVFYGTTSGGGGTLDLYAGAAPIQFSTNSAQRMIIDSSGNVGIGTASPFGRFQVVGSAISSPVESIFSTASGDTAYPATLISKYDNDTTTSQVFIRFAVNNNTTTSGQINANGANSAAFGTWSDERLKDNIVNLPSQLANICALRPVEFDYKDGSGHQIGFVAQEMKTVYPDAVGTGTDDMLTITGWSKTEARLVAAIQELEARLAKLETAQ